VIVTPYGQLLLKPSKCPTAAQLEPAAKLSQRLEFGGGAEVRTLTSKRGREDRVGCSVFAVEWEVA
jgi:hypothetical protein